MAELTPLVSEVDIFALLESITVNDEVVPVWDAHRLMLAVCNSYESERQALHLAAAAALGWIDEIYPAEVFDGSSGDEGPVRIAAIRETLRKALTEANATQS